MLLVNEQQQQLDVLDQFGSVLHDASDPVAFAAHRPQPKAQNPPTRRR